MAQKKGGGSTRNGRDSQPKMLGVKAFGGELISAGSIIVRQRGTRFHPGTNVGVGKDHTLFALVDGHVSFATKGAMNKQTVSVVPAANGALARSPSAAAREAPIRRGFVFFERAKSILSAYEIRRRSLHRHRRGRRWERLRLVPPREVQGIRRPQRRRRRPRRPRVRGGGPATSTRWWTTASRAGTRPSAASTAWARTCSAPPATTSC